MKKLIASVALAPLAFGGLSVADTGNQPQLNLLEDLKAGQAYHMDYQIKASAWVLILPITGKANFSVDLYPQAYQMRSTVKTTGLADILVNYDMQLAASGYRTDKGLQTYTYISQNNDGKKNRRVDLQYGADSFTMNAVPTFGNLGDPAATTEQVLDAKDPISALISFALEPRAEGEDPCGGPLKIFDGRQLTHLHLTNHGMTNVKADAWQGQAYECHVRMDKVAGYKEGEANKDTLTGIDGPLKMFLAPLPNGTTVPVRIEADTDDIGKVVLQASRLSFTPIDTPS